MLFVGCPLLVADVMERDIVLLGERFEVVVVADDDLDIRAEVAIGPGVEEGFATV